MKIDNQPRGWNAPQNVTKADAAQTGKFQQALAARTSPQEPKDTLTISYHAPAAEEAPAGVAASGAVSVPSAAEAAVRSTAPRTAGTEILPEDSIDVKLAKLQRQGEEADYTGMSYGEIYSAIWNRYNDAFDGNWPAILSFPSIQEKGDVVTYYFRRECNRNINGPLRQEFKAETGINVMTWSKDEWPQHGRDMEVYYKYVLSKYGNFRAQVLGYGDMTIKEAEQAIYEKYAGKDTLRDFLNMQGELFQTGVMTDKLGGDGASAYWRTLNEQLIKTYFPDIYYDFSNDLPINVPQYRWDAVLDGKFDARAFAADMRETVRNTTYSGWDFDIEGAISKGIDYLLEAVAKAQQAQQERHAEWEKRAERAEASERAE